jgi:hypothetical protein
MVEAKYGQQVTEDNYLVFTDRKVFKAEATVKDIQDYVDTFSIGTVATICVIDINEENHD